MNNLVTIRHLGRGVFSSVDMVKDNSTGTFYAKKIISPKYIKYSQHELRLLSIFKRIRHKNIVRFFEKQNHKDTICFILEKLHLNLYNFYKQYPEKINNNLICSFTKQILEGLEFIHSLFIIHADLKPENVMTTNLKENHIKLIDFGSSIINGTEKHTHFYIVSRYYRAPELVYKRQFDEKIDIWSVGCILYELIVFKPLFYARNTEMLKMLMTSLSYEKKFIKYIQRNQLFDNLSIREQMYLGDVFYNTLEYDFKKRLSAKQCLELPYFDLIRDK
jgi:serine/threonine protein kinase